MGVHIIGGVQCLVLSAVRKLGNGAYGVSIQREILHATGSDMAFGTIYASLERLEGHGLVTSRMGEATKERGGRAKKYFDITQDGLAAIARHERDMAALR